MIKVMTSGGHEEYNQLLQSEASKLPIGRIIFEPAVLPNEIVAYVDIGIYILPNVIAHKLNGETEMAKVLEVVRKFAKIEDEA